jgi:F-type H+-transporting ATPase subunit a
MPDFKYISRFKKLFLAVSLLFVLPSFSFAADENGKKLDAGEMIMEHVKDAHSWHIAGNVAVPLPIIVYSSGHGLSVFCSNKLDDGAVYDGYKMDKEHIVFANPNETAKIWDFSLTKNAVEILLAGLLLILVMNGVSKAYKKGVGSAPKGMQSFFEPVIIFVRDEIAIPCIGKKKHEKFVPYLLTVFFLILFLNLLGLIPFFPGGANVTGNVSITVSLAIFTFIPMMVFSTKTYWAHTLWMPGVPAVVKILILGPIETLGVILKPFTLMIRLFANILAGHIVALSFFSLIFIFGGLWGHFAGYATSVFSVAFTVAMLLLDLLVALIQAFVFTLLSAIYFGMVTEEPAHH